jgi:hypothetical protein
MGGKTRLEAPLGPGQVKVDILVRWKGKDVVVEVSPCGRAGELAFPACMTCHVDMKCVVV